MTITASEHAAAHGPTLTRALCVLIAIGLLEFVWWSFVAYGIALAAR